MTKHEYPILLLIMKTRNILASKVDPFLFARFLYLVFSSIPKQYSNDLSATSLQGDSKTARVLPGRRRVKGKYTK